MNRLSCIKVEFGFGKGVDFLEESINFGAVSTFKILTGLVDALVHDALVSLDGVT